MCSLVSAEPSARGCGVPASRPCGVTRSDSFSTPLRPPCSSCGSPALTKAERRLSKTRSTAAVLMGVGSRSALPGHAAGEHLDEHGQVPAQAVEGMPEGGGRVVLEEVMPRPGGEVPCERHGEQPPPVPGEQRAAGEGEREQRADYMQAARDRVGVLAEVVRIELAKTREARRLSGERLCHRGPDPWRGDPKRRASVSGT